MNIRKILLFIGIILLLWACSKQIESTAVVERNIDSNISEKKLVLKNIDLKDFKKELLKKDGILIDLRTTQELEKTGIIDGAKQIDFYSSDFTDTLNSLDKNKKYLIYCQSGWRSGKTLSLMKNLGFTNVRELRWGMNAWLKAQEKTVPFRSKWEDTDMMEDGMMESRETMMNESSEENMISMMPRTITLNARKWEFDKTTIRAKKWENLIIKINNLDGLHGIAIPWMQLVWDNEVRVDTSKTWEYTFQCLNYCGQWHQNMTWKLIIE